MKRLVFIVILHIIFCMQLFSQEISYGTNKKFWANRVTLQDMKTNVVVSKKIDIPVSIVWVNEKITIYAQMYQEYEIISSGNVTSIKGQKMVTWYIRNQQGITGRLTLGVIKNEGLKLMVTYPDLAWTYDIIEEKRND
jgi:hypothetical protein